MLFRATPLGMNRRNQIIRQLNGKESLRLAKDKSAFKRLLVENGIRTPRTYHEVHDFSDMRLISFFPDEFVVKPCKGFGGSGIVLLKRDGDAFADPVGQRYTDREVRFHIRRINDGDFSGYLENDVAIVEERIFPSKLLQFKNSVGLPDIRVFCHQFEPVMAMMRYPTFKSKGKANLTMGAVGIGIAIDGGGITRIRAKKVKAEFLPEDLEIPPGFTMPRWEEMKAIARKCSVLARLRLAGVDIIMGAEDNLMVLEINGRPGLEIQNVNEESLLRRIQEHGEIPLT